MKCRRYKVENEKLSVYYTEEEGDIVGYEGYYMGQRASEFNKRAPKDTIYMYLSCLREWGYSEVVPSPKCCLFGTPKMISIAKMLETENVVI